jgi:protein arginine N-methyltransferase 1
MSLPEPADIIISDLRGLLPWFQKHVPAIIDARTRLLAPHGRLIPASDTVWAALIESDELYSQYVNPWCSKLEGVDLSAARQFAINLWGKGQKISSSQFLGQPQMWATLDYASIDCSNVSSLISWTIDKPGTAHGISLWFDTVLCDGIGFSNCPTDPQLIYGNAFVPFSDPIQVDSGETVTLRLQATLVGEDYVWVWNTIVSSSDHPRLELKQSSLFGSPLLREQVARRTENYVADLGEDGLIDRTALDLIDGKTTLAEISERLLEKFPARFSNRQEALTKVGELSVRYSGAGRSI